MDREDYTKITERPDVLDEIVLEGIKAVLVEERSTASREIEQTLKGQPIEQPELEMGMSKLLHYELAVRPPRAREILGVLRGAESMYGSGARFHDCELRRLRAEWSRYCKALKANRQPAARARSASAAGRSA